MNASDFAGLVFSKPKRDESGQVVRDDVLQALWLQDAERMALGEIPQVDRDTWLKQKREEMLRQQEIARPDQVILR
jgi:hypothetical protein